MENITAISEVKKKSYIYSRNTYLVHSTFQAWKMQYIYSRPLRSSKSGKEDRNSIYCGSLVLE